MKLNRFNEFLEDMNPEAAREMGRVDLRIKDIKAFIQQELDNQKKEMIERIEKEMVKVPPNKEYNSTGDSYFNLGCLKAIEIIKSFFR